MGNEATKIKTWEMKRRALRTFQTDPPLSSPRVVHHVLLALGIAILILVVSGVRLLVWVGCHHARTVSSASAAVSSSPSILSTTTTVVDRLLSVSYRSFFLTLAAPLASWFVLPGGICDSARAYSLSPYDLSPSLGLRWYVVTNSPSKPRLIQYNPVTQIYVHIYIQI